MDPYFVVIYYHCINDTRVPKTVFSDGYHYSINLMEIHKYYEVQP